MADGSLSRDAVTALVKRDCLDHPHLSKLIAEYAVADVLYVGLCVWEPAPENLRIDHMGFSNNGLFTGVAQTNVSVASFPEMVFTNPYDGVPQAFIPNCFAIHEFRFSVDLNPVNRVDWKEMLKVKRRPFKRLKI